MNFKELALLFDAQTKPVEAAWAYEIAIGSHEAEIELFLNLAVIYFVCQDFGYSSHHNLSDEFVSSSRDRAFEVLNLAEKIFGCQTDILFWREYFTFINSENEKIDEVVAELVLKTDSLTPFLYLFNNSGRKEFKNEAKELLGRVMLGLTERDRYIRSVLE